MPKLVADNDYFLIEIEQNQYGFIEPGKEGIETGRVVAIAENPIYFGANTFMFDKSLMDKPLLQEIYEHYKQYVGKKVYWPAYTERGAVVQHEGKQYAHVKWSAIMSHIEEKD